MSDERPPLQDRHFEQLCQFVLEYGIPFPEMYHKQIAQRLLELIPPVRDRGAVLKATRQRLDGMSNGLSKTVLRKPKRAN